MVSVATEGGEGVFAGTDVDFPLHRGPFSTLASKLDVAALTFVACYGLGELVRVHWTPRHLETELNRWRWKNTTVSLIHSTLSGIAAIYWCIVLILPMRPEYITDQNMYGPNAERLLSFTTGYFLYDVWDMLRHQPSRQSFELIAHHLPVVFAFCVSLAIGKFGGIAVTGLAVEASSAFLHTRQLMLLNGCSKDNRIFRLISIINLAAFVPCRFGAMGWVIIWTVVHKAYVASPYYEVVVYSTSIVALLNAGLFCRLYRSDVLRLQRQDSSSKVKDKDTSRYPSYPTDLGDLTHIEVHTRPEFYSVLAESA